MAITFGTISSYASDTDYPWNYTSPATVNTTGAIALLLIIVNGSSRSKPPLTVTYQGTVMTLLGDITSPKGKEWAYGLVNPVQTATGSFNVSVTANGDPTAYVAIPILSGNANPFGAVSTGDFAQGGTITDSLVTTGENSIIIGGIMASSGPAPSGWTHGGSSPTPTFIIINDMQSRAQSKIMRQDAGADGSTVTLTNTMRYNTHGIMMVELLDSGGPTPQILTVPGINASFFLGSHAVENQFQIIAPESLYTISVMGSLSATYIAHHQGIQATPAFGTPIVSYRTLVIGISNPILLGTPTLVISTWLLKSEGIMADPALGSPAVHLNIQMAGIHSAGVTGEPSVWQIINHAGIELQAMLGDHTVSPVTWNLIPVGITNDSFIGNPEAYYFIRVSSSINESFLGDHLIDYVYNDAGIYLQGINNQNRFGTHQINQRLYVLGILDDDTQFGLSVVQGQNALEPEGISLDPQFGDHQTNLILRHLSIKNLFHMGTPSVIQRFFAIGIALNIQLGSHTVILGEWAINPKGILNNTLFGTPRLNNEFTPRITYIKMAGAWVAVDKMLMKHDGQWRELLSILEKVDGSWQEMT